MASEPVVALDPYAGDSILDASALEICLAARIAVAFVCVPPARPTARSATLSPHIDQLLETTESCPLASAAHHISGMPCASVMR
jgi:hypothetical protein